jgi:hypothetical protein
MDDNKFDDIIKAKVVGFEDSSFDPSALAAFHNRLATDASWPWHVRYRIEIIAGTAVAIVILFTLWGQWHFAELKTERLEDELIALKTQNEKMGELIGEIKNLKTITTPADTIRIFQFRESHPFLYGKLVKEINALNNSLSDSFRAAAGKRDYRDMALADANNRQAYPGVFENQFSPYPIKGFALPKEDSSTRTNATGNQEGKKLSAKEIIKGEKYRKGVGFRLGPTAEASQGFYRRGNGEINIGYGIAGDFILSPSLSFETGLKYVHRFYSVPENELNKISLPFVNQAIGDMKFAEIDSWILEVPLNMKYRVPLSTKNSFLYRIGYSPIIYASQTLEYSYEYDVTKNLYLKDSHKNKGAHFYAGTANFSLGASRQLKNKEIIELGIFYQQGLGGMGLEKNKSSFLGLRSVYWFPLR